MSISLCNTTVGLPLPSHDTLAVLTTQSTFYGGRWRRNDDDDNDSVMSDDGESGEK
jgi:hypothetical protein